MALRLAGILLACCAASCVSLIDAPSEYVFEPGADRGLVVLSTRTVDECYQKYEEIDVRVVGIRDRDGGWEAGRFPFVYHSRRFDYRDPAGYLVVREFPAGQYHLDFINKTVNTKTSSSPKPLNMTFTVAPRTVTYLGELYLEITKKDCDVFRVAVADRREQDRKMFDAKMKNIKSDKFTYQVLKRK